MSEQLNKEIRDFFIKLGQDIKNAFDRCCIACPCHCTCFDNRKRISAESVRDVEQQVTIDINNIDDLTETNKYDDSNKNDLIFKKKIIINLKNQRVDPETHFTESNNIIGTKENDSSDLESDEDFIIIY